MDFRFFSTAERASIRDPRPSAVASFNRRCVLWFVGRAFVRVPARFVRRFFHGYFWGRKTGPSNGLLRFVGRLIGLRQVKSIFRKPADGDFISGRRLLSALMPEFCYDPYFF